MRQRVADQGDLKKYRTEIPNIVCDLGLSPYEMTLYTHLKRTAGAGGVCWKSTATLARETGMSSGMVSKAKIGLQASRPLLKKPLINITEETNKKGGKANHAITIADIWAENMAYFASSLHEVDSPSSSYSEVASSPHERTSSPGEIKKELLEEGTKEEEDRRDFISKLRTDPFYSHVDFDVEVERMRRWLARSENKGRRMTERFVLNWVEKIDRPITSPSTTVVIDRAERDRELARRAGYAV